MQWHIHYLDTVKKQVQAAIEYGLTLEQKDNDDFVVTDNRKTS